MKKILITGSNGFIGKNLCDFFSKKYDVVKSNKNDNLHEILKNSKPQIIVHCAAEIYNPELMFDSNVLYTKCILDYCKCNNVEKLLVLGSSSEYGFKSNKMKESDLIEPRTIYEATKSAASMLVQGYANVYQIPTLLIRPFTIVGRHEKPHKFFPTLYRSWKLDKEIQLSMGVHDFVFIDDFLRAFDFILNQKNENFDIVNIGSGYQTDNYRIVEVFEEVLKYKYKKVLCDKLRSFDSLNWIADTEKLFSKFGIKITQDIDAYLYQGVSKFIEDCEELKIYV
jgi:nucleoside-diphosphate-sugar epimerase